MVGISPDPPAKLRKFRDEQGLTFPLLSDPDHRVLEAFGAWGQKSLYGKTVTGVLKSEGAKEIKLITPEGQPVTVAKAHGNWC